MTYVMSDIHGRYEKYLEMLKQIGFKDSDDLYVIGDMIDIGKHPIAVLKDMSMRANVFPILGDHEYTALKILKKMKESGKSETENSEILVDWLKSGGDTTAAAFAELDSEEREALIEYLEDLPLYEEVVVGKDKYILVHAGLASYRPGRELDDYSPEELVFEKADIKCRYFDDATLVSGHEVLINEGKIQRKAVRQNGNYSINCGEYEDEPLCAVCLDNGKEYYV